MKIAEVSAYPATTHSSAPPEACSRDWIEGSATFTMKKSRTTMNVPTSTTGSGSHLLAVTRGRGVTIDEVLMPSTVPVVGAGVDYLPGRSLTSGVIDKPHSRPQPSPGQTTTRRNPYAGDHRALPRRLQ